MKAVIAKSYGNPEVLSVNEFAKPTPKQSEVLIKIHTATVGPADIAFRKGEPFIVRFFAGFFRPKNIPGTEFAGEIEAVGENVKNFKIGDKVFGMSALESGAHAEYKCLPENGIICKMPSNLSFEEAISIVDGPMTALIFLRDKAKIQKNQTILINGASGSVGSAAVQIAKYYGAKVVGVCSGKNIDIVKSLGADEVIDYTKIDFTKVENKYGFIFDAVGKSSFSKAKNSLKPNGVFLSTIPDPTIIFLNLWTKFFGKKKVIFAATGLEQKVENLEFLKELAEKKIIKPLIDRVYKLEQIVEAHKYVEAGHKIGSVVLKVV